MGSGAIGLIGGTSVYNLDLFSDVREEEITTKFGSVPARLGSCQGREVVFISRHGSGHAVPPHRVNYRANIMAMKELGVTEMLATASVGSLNRAMYPGDLVVLDQFIDCTKTRVYTFYDGDTGVVHVDMTEPYCPRLRKVILGVTGDLPARVHPRGTYVCTEGPRFETPAEIEMFRRFGGDLVGMTNVPEVVLAREAEICYATIAVVTNYAAGLALEPLTHQEVVETMARSSSHLQHLLTTTILSLPGTGHCRCREALKELGKF